MVDNIAGRTFQVTEGAAQECVFYKDKDERLDFTIDWTARLNETEHINASTWRDQKGDAVIGELNKDEEHIDTEDNLSTLWVTGGRDGRTYRITNHITTDEGRQMDFSFDIEIITR